MTISADPETWGDAELLPERPVPDTSRVDRLRATVRGRGVVPTPVALAATDVVYRTATRLRGGARARAEATMRAVLPPGTPEEEVRRLAPLHVASMARAWELTWRPEALLRMDVQGEEHLRAAQAAGRGLVVSFVHYGPEMAWARIGDLLPVLLGVGQWLAEPTPPGYGGLQVEQCRRILAASGFQMVCVDGSARRMMGVLKAGGTLLLAMDVPGPTVTRYLGKEVEMADGTARMATLTGALVLPGAVVPDGSRWALRLLPALDPREHARGELHQALADLQSEIVLRAPEHTGSPLRPGFWAHADARRWSRA